MIRYLKQFGYRFELTEIFNFCYVLHYGLMLQIYLCAMGHCGGFGEVRPLQQIWWCTMGLCSEFGFTLWTTVADLVVRYGSLCRMRPYNKNLWLSPGPAAVSGGQASPLCSPGGGGDPHYIGTQERTYIYSHLYTVLRALDRLLWSFTAANMVEGSANVFLWLNKPPALPFAAFHHPPWDSSLVFALRPWENTIALVRGHSFYSCILP
jgi:hypothetical protein